MNYPADPLELKVERLLRSCAILPMLKGFYPLRDLVLLYCRGEAAPGNTRKTSSILTPKYGRHYREAMRCALAHSWHRPESRLMQIMARGSLDRPPEAEEFARAVYRQLKAPALS